MGYRSLPHNTTGGSATELLFNQKMRGKIPDVILQSVHDQQVCDRDAEKKEMSQAYTDSWRGASCVGDLVLVKQDKTNKLSTTFNSNPFCVINKTRNNVIVEDTAGNRYSRNTNYENKYISSEASFKSSSEVESLVMLTRL